MSERLDLSVGRELLDFTGGGRSAIPISDAEEQLKGAVAVHNLLHDQGVAYLADEVGMGKTYVALGAVALFRHFQPNFRVLVIAPREIIQNKWMKEWRSFVARVVRVEDMRMKGIGGVPARALVKVDSLADLVAKASHDPDRDFFARLTSFSLAVSANADHLISRRRRLLTVIPWLRADILHAHNKETYKRNVARAVNCALPHFDLVIVDEGHNLKAGWRDAKSSIRNTVVACALGGRDIDDEYANEFRGYGRRATKVLFLSATPIEDNFRQLWNQLDLFGYGRAWERLKDDTLGDDDRRTLVHKLLIRRTAQLISRSGPLTKSEYRTEWRSGGVETHDEPLRTGSDKERLAVALIQKKVAELIGSAEHKHSFQVGLLASFESFLETAATTQRQGDPSPDDGFEEDESEEGLFHRGAEELAASRDGPREGVDVIAINRIARDYRSKFREELPHPKMDALVNRLAAAFTTGQKALVFVRRVASVDELQRKLEDKYDQRLFGYLRDGLSSDELRKELESQITAYCEARADERHKIRARDLGVARNGAATEQSSVDSFFAWFFRGEGPRGVRSGASLAEQLDQASGNYATLFEDNYVAWLLGVTPSEVPTAMAKHLEQPEDVVMLALAKLASRYIKATKMQRLERFAAFQIAALELLEGHGAAIGKQAVIVRQEALGDYLPQGRVDQNTDDARRWLTHETLFTLLRSRPDLRKALWPEPTEKSFQRRFVEQERRRQLIASMIRKGHPIIDLFILVTNRIGTLKLRAQETREGDASGLAAAFLDLLADQQLKRPSEFSSFSELAAAAENFALITQLNAPDLETAPLKDNAVAFGRLLRAQRPVGGMAGAVNSILVRQFRMPGYPLVLITTDLLKEGEDLHAFCSDVFHYGIAWMPSELEQRVGRVDRVGSQTARRLASLPCNPDKADKLQVYYPHLKDTVEVLQLGRVYERLNRFLRIMHEGLGLPPKELARIDVIEESIRGFRDTAVIDKPLRSAFPVTESMLKGKLRSLAHTGAMSDGLRSRFLSLIDLLATLGARDIQRRFDNQLVGEFVVGRRVQPFTLLLRALHGHAIVRCVSPVGVIDVPDWDDHEAARLAAEPFARVSLEKDDQFKRYNVAVEGDMLLGDAQHDIPRARLLLNSIIETADRVEREVLRVDQPLARVSAEIDMELTVER